MDQPRGRLTVRPYDGAGRDQEGPDQE